MEVRSLHHGGCWTSASRQVPTIQEIITEQALGTAVLMFRSIRTHHSRIVPSESPAEIPLQEVPEVQIVKRFKQVAEDLLVQKSSSFRPDVHCMSITT